MEVTMREESRDYKAPISVNGWFGANFPHRVRGHYFWFVSASKLLPRTSGTLYGRVTGVKAFNVYVVVEEAKLSACADLNCFHVLV